jgi:hypothetical protein
VLFSFRKSGIPGLLDRDIPRNICCRSVAARVGNAVPEGDRLGIKGDYLIRPVFRVMNSLNPKVNFHG